MRETILNDENVRLLEPVLRFLVNIHCFWAAQLLSLTIYIIDCCGCWDLSINLLLSYTKNTFTAWILISQLCEVHRDESPQQSTAGAERWSSRNIQPRSKFFEHYSTDAVMSWTRGISLPAIFFNLLNENTVVEFSEWREISYSLIEVFKVDLKTNDVIV